MKKKIFLLFLSIFSLTIISFFLSINLFINQHVIKELNTNNGNSFFSGYVFNKNILGKIETHNVLKAKVIDVGNTLLYSPHIVTLSKDKWIILMYKNSISLYSISLNKLYRFSVPYGNIISGCISTLNNKDQNNLLLLVSKTKSKYADDLIVSSIIEDNHGIRFKTLCKKSLKNLRPWKIQTGDVDGDGKKEISIGMYKTTHFDPVMAKRPFIYQWNGNGIFPKWLGSRLSRPFDDYIFDDINHDGRDEIISIERMQNGHKIISAYAWKGFGFESIGESQEFQDIFEITKVNSINNIKYSIKVKAEIKNTTAFYTLSYKNDMLLAEVRNN